MKNFWFYVSVGTCCLLMALFTVYTGMSLFGMDVKAAGTEAPIIHYVAPVPDRTGPRAEPEPDQADAPAVENTAEPDPLLPENGKVLFLGNSLVQGLQAACDHADADFICKKGISLPGLDKMLEGRDLSGYGLAVIEMGSNELGLWSESDFESAYGGILDRLDCKAVCLSIPPVCEAKSGYSGRVCNANVIEYNSWISDLCGDREGAIYLDCGAFFGESLDPKMTGDGLHLNYAGYRSWLEWVFDMLTGGYDDVPVP